MLNIKARCRVRTLTIVLSAALLNSCGGHSGAPSTPRLVIECPGTQLFQTSDATASVAYPAPTVTGGTPPLTISCVPPSGGTFAVGSTAVNCTVTDATKNAAACDFDVTVGTVPRLNVRRFVAFGDSITAGTLPSDCGISSANCAIMTLRTEAQRQLALQRMFANLEASPVAYPSVLQTMLTGRYISQSITVTNEGNPNEIVAGGKDRLPSTLTNGAEVLLLMEGANDMNLGHPVDDVTDHLRSMVRESVNRGVIVFLATVLPQRPHACRAYDFCDGVVDTALLNDRLRIVAQSEGATLVDLYSDFAEQTDVLLGVDGLHPNEMGYRRMAELFFAAITQRLEHRSQSATTTIHTDRDTSSDYARPVWSVK